MDINTSNPAAKDMAPVETTAPSKMDTAEPIQNSQSAENAKESPDKIISAKEAMELTEEMNGLMDDLQTCLGFSIHEKFNHQVVVKIKNRDTNELIRQIPAEELLQIKEKMDEFTGLIFDQSV